MTKNVQLKIVSIQKTDDGKDTQEMTVAGTVSYDDNKVVIEYFEDNDEMGREKSTLTVTDGKEVCIIREGPFSSEMTVEDGARHTNFYKTPYGEFTMGVYGTNVSFLRNEKQSVLRMTYDLDFNNGFFSQNTMNIYIDEK